MSQLGVGAKVSDGHDNLEGSIDGAPYTKTDTPGSVTSETSETAFVMHQQHEGYQSYSSRPAY